MDRGKKVTVFILILTLLISTNLIIGFGGQALTDDDIEAIIEEVAIEKNIPPVILKAIAWKESNYNQFDKKGNPFVSYGNTGIMQINKVHKSFDQERLRYDIRYNIEAGADILLGKWYGAGKSLPTVGDNDPMILENWYFALWGYNGWVARNNPNVSGQKAYQEGIFQLIREKYNQPITSIDPVYLPSTGLPNKELLVPTPDLHHYADFTRKMGKVFTDIKDHPKQEYIEHLYAMGIVSGTGKNVFSPDNYVTKEQAAKILTDALDLEQIQEEMICQDWDEISDWAIDYVVTAYKHGILPVDDEGLIRPGDYLTREEGIKLIFESFKEEIIKEEDLLTPIIYIDVEEINPAYIDNVAYLIGKGVLSPQENQELRPSDFITRAELCHWIYNSMDKLK